MLLLERMRYPVSPTLAASKVPQGPRGLLLLLLLLGEELLATDRMQAVQDPTTFLEAAYLNPPAIISTASGTEGVAEEREEIDCWQPSSNARG